MFEETSKPAIGEPDEVLNSDGWITHRNKKEEIPER